MLPPPRRENKGNPDSKVSASSVPIQDGAIKKKKKKISGYYIWVTKGRINQKEKKRKILDRKYLYLDEIYRHSGHSNIVVPQFKTCTNIFLLVRASRKLPFIIGAIFR